uniref:Uncharacterized protein n=1 Tax=Oryza punctata TaxID=4537 RepID=A0A0E0JJ64_ORYPU
MAWRTGGCAGRCLLPLVLLAASLLDWSLISLVNMIFFFAIRFVAPRRAQITFHLLWCIEGEGWIVAHSWWAKLVGFARWWRLLEIYSVFIILLLYVYQLPVKFPYVVLAFADFIGLFKISSNSEWPEVSSGISLLFYYFMLSSAKQDIQDMDSLMSLENDSLAEELLPSRNVFLVRQSRRHANVLLRGSVFRTFSINFFTYGFPDMMIWETIGLWHYSIPGLFLLAQFCLGVFVALCNLVNNSVFLYTTTEGGASSSDDHLIDEKEDTMVLIVATLAWGLRKLSRAITLMLLFLLVVKPGFIHAVYISSALERSGSLTMEAGLNKSVLLSVYNSQNSRNGQADRSTHEKKIASYLSKIGQKFLWVYRSYGTYVAFLTILLTLYLATCGEDKETALVSTKRLVSKFVKLYPDLGFDPKASLLMNVWQSLAVLVVMQLYSYERRQNSDKNFGVSDASESGLLGFLRRLLIWHSEKILSVTHYDSGFWGVEYGLRGKVLVIVACTIQYNVFHWLDLMPTSLVHEGKWEEPCQLFISGDTSSSARGNNKESHSSNRFSSLFSKVQGLIHSSSSSSMSSGSTCQTSEPVQNETSGSDEGKRYSFSKIWGMSKESHKWDKRKIISLKRERFETQKTTFKCYMKFWMENLFKLRGLEINMIVLLLASFTLLNVISIFYITCLVECPGYIVSMTLKSIVVNAGKIQGFSLHIAHNVGWITSRSAFVEIVIFLLVSIQSYIFSSGEFDYVSRYLEAEQIGAMVREQEKKALKKTEQLQHLRRSEEQKRERNMQVERMKSEMYNLQSQLNRMNSFTPINNASHSEGLRHRRNTKLYTDNDTPLQDSGIGSPRKEDKTGSTDSSQSFEFSVEDTQKSLTDLMFRTPCDTPRSPIRGTSEEFKVTDNAWNSLGSTSEITELEENEGKVNPNLLKLQNGRGAVKENPLKSAVQLIGDGVSQVQSFGNQAVTNIVSFLNIDPEEPHSSDHPAEGDIYDMVESQRETHDGQLLRTHSVTSGNGTKSSANMPIGVIFRLLSMVYLGALFLYALCVNYGPSYLFWVIVLIYTELNILSQYIYQIVIQHCGLNIHIPLLQRFGFPDDKIKASFVVSILPLFLSSITAKDGEWVPVTEFSFLSARNNVEEKQRMPYNWRERLKNIHLPVMNLIRMIGRGISRYWLSLTQGAESPPYFVQVTMEVNHWPEDGIQPERIESAINRVLAIAHEERCQANSPSSCHSCSRVRIQSIERSKENSSMALAVLEVVYAAPLDCQSAGWYKSLTPAADVEKEIHESQKAGLFEDIRYGIPNKSNLYRQFLTSKVTQLEDIYASLFLVKCDAILNRANHQQGEKQTKMTKFCSGICLFFIYSSGNPTNIANPIIDVSVKIDIKALGGRLTFFKTTVCEKIPWKHMRAYDDVDPLDYLGAYNVEDIQLICCQPDASTMWLIPAPVQSRFIQSLEETEMIFGNMELILNWDFLRARPKGKELVKYESPVDRSPSVDDVKRVLNGTTNSFRITDAYPRYFRVTGSGEVRRLEASIDSVSGELLLNNGTAPWWSFYDTNPSDLAGCQGLNGPMAIVVSEETPQGIIGETLSKFSIWSLYITFVLAVARFIRLQCSDLRMRIPYENLPSCDRLLDICEGIYAARAEGELEVEEVLYWTLNINGLFEKLEIVAGPLSIQTNKIVHFLGYVTIQSQFARQNLGYLGSWIRVSWRF